MNRRVYDAVNNGVYRCGFASAQPAYEEAFDALFDALDFLEQRLAQRRYLIGDSVTEADWRLFTTLIRFDAVYHGHFKCNRQRLIDFPNLFNYLLDLYQLPGIADTVKFDHIKRHYYYSHKKINPSQIVPKGPAQDLTQPHDRQVVRPNGNGFKWVHRSMISSGNFARLSASVTPVITKPEAVGRGRFEAGGFTPRMGAACKTPVTIGASTAIAARGHPDGAFHEGKQSGRVRRGGRSLR